MPTNPFSGLTLKELMTSEQLLPANNLADLPNRDLALDNLGVSASLADLNTLDGMAVTATIALAAGSGTDEMDITVTVKNAAGATVAASHVLEMWISDADTGIGLTANDADADMTADTGAILKAHTAEKHWTIQTAATGIFVGVIADAQNPADLYVAVKKPLGAGIVVSDATAADSWEGGA